MTKKTKFRKRYVLGEGHPEFYYASELVGMVYSDHRHYLLKIDVPPELLGFDIPKYRLVLEKVKP